MPLQSGDLVSGKATGVPISSDFSIVLLYGNPAALKNTFQRFAGDLNSNDPRQVGWAQWAIVYMAPADFEPLIENLARIPPYGERGRNLWYPVDGVDGLTRLNTASGCRLLAYLAEHDGRSDAVEGLGKTGIKSYLPLLMRLFQNPKLADSSAKAMGMLGGEDAMQFLITQLHSSNVTDRQNAAVGLGYTGDRNAVRPLITALYDQNETVRSDALSTLGRLTHPHTI